jgi:hypothetical protein
MDAPAAIKSSPAETGKIRIYQDCNSRFRAAQNLQLVAARPLDSCALHS